MMVKKVERFFNVTSSILLSDLYHVEGQRWWNSGAGSPTLPSIWSKLTIRDIFPLYHP